MTPEHYAGRRVAALRAEADLTQSELAARLSDLGHEMHQTTVAKLESGRRPLRLNELASLAKILGVPLSNLLPKDESPSGYELALLEAKEMARRVEYLQSRRDALAVTFDEVSQDLAVAQADFNAAMARLDDEAAQRELNHG